jgi:hypothetical protein
MPPLLVLRDRRSVTGFSEEGCSPVASGSAACEVPQVLGGGTENDGGLLQRQHRGVAEHPDRNVSHEPS